jgi:TRAP-type C4-dicarboxylate transport system permease small subunit
METFKKIVKSYDAIEMKFLIFVMAILVVVTFAQVFTRYVMGAALFWSEELAKYLFVWISWLGVSAGLKEKEHIQVKLLPEALHAKGHLKTEKGLLILIDLLWFITSIVVLYYGFIIVAGQMETGVYGPSTGIPMWINYLCVPVRAVIVCLRLIGGMIVNSYELVCMFRRGGR